MWRSDCRGLPIQQAAVAFVPKLRPAVINKPSNESPRHGRRHTRREQDREFQILEKAPMVNLRGF
jgi:hypothetical protein